MVTVPPSPWKYATTRTLIAVLIITAILGTAFYRLVRLVFSEASQPVSEEAKEQLWRDIEAVQARKRVAERSDSVNHHATPAQPSAGTR